MGAVVGTVQPMRCRPSVAEAQARVLHPAFLGLPQLVGQRICPLRGLAGVVCRVWALHQGLWPAWARWALPRGGALCFTVHCLFPSELPIPSVRVSSSGVDGSLSARSGRSRDWPTGAV